MPRTPRNRRTALTDHVRTIEVGDPPAAAPHEAPKPTSWAVPGAPNRSRLPNVGAADHESRKHVPAPVVRPETAAPVSIKARREGR